MIRKSYITFIVMIFIFDLLQVVNSEELQLHQRRLSSYVTDGSQSDATVSGNKRVDVLLQAKDELGNNITTGGDNFVIEIKNECIMDGFGNCVTVNGAAVVMNPEIKSAMTDNLNGTYSYSFTPTANGKISILVYSYQNLIIVILNNILY